MIRLVRADLSLMDAALAGDEPLARALGHGVVAGWATFTGALRPTRDALAAIPEGSRWGRPCTVWHPVPRDLGRNRHRADAFHSSWLRWCGPSELRYCHGTDESLALAAATAGGEAWETQRRRIWR